MLAQKFPLTVRPCVNVLCTVVSKRRVSPRFEQAPRVTADENALVRTPESIVLVLHKYKTASAYGRHVEEIQSDDIRTQVLFAPAWQHTRAHVSLSRRLT
jgi:hypothetical protein